VLLRDLDAAVARQPRNTFDRNAGKKHLDRERIAKAVGIGVRDFRSKSHCNFLVQSFATVSELEAPLQKKCVSLAGRKLASASIASGGSGTQTGDGLGRVQKQFSSGNSIASESSRVAYT
jgi:hypothetical protein